MIARQIFTLSYRRFGLSAVSSHPQSYGRFSRRPRRVLPSDDEVRRSEQSEIRRGSEVRYSNGDLQRDYASRNFLSNQRRKFEEYDEEEKDENYSQPSSYESRPDNRWQKYAEIEEKQGHTPQRRIPKNRRFAILPKDDDRKTYSNENGLTWKILGPKDYGFIKLMVQMRSSNASEIKEDKILLEGKRLIAEGLTAGLKLHYLFFLEPYILDELPLIRDEGELYRISEERMEAWTDMASGPGVIAIMEKPGNDFVVERQSAVKIPLTAIFDRVTDPRNFGSVIRTLAAVGCEKILVLDGTCDPWAPTVLRGGMGAHFAIPIYRNVGWEMLRGQLPDDVDVVLADSNSYEVTCEAESIKDPPYSTTNEVKSTGVGIVEEKNEGDGKRRKIIVDNDLVRPDRRYQMMQLPVMNIFETDFADSNHVALIIGGETTGMSVAAYHFAHKYHGVRCHVPMSNGVNSLNVATATGVIVYEMKRQFDLVRNSSEAKKFTSTDGRTRRSPKNEFFP